MALSFPIVYSTISLFTLKNYQILQGPLREITIAFPSPFPFPFPFGSPRWKRRNGAQAEENAAAAAPPPLPSPLLPPLALPRLRLHPHRRHADASALLDHPRPRPRELRSSWRRQGREVRRRRCSPASGRRRAAAAAPRSTPASSKSHVSVLPPNTSLSQVPGRGFGLICCAIFLFWRDWAWICREGLLQEGVRRGRRHLGRVWVLSSAKCRCELIHPLITRFWFCWWFSSSPIQIFSIGWDIYVMLFVAVLVNGWKINIRRICFTPLMEIMFWSSIVLVCG